MIPHEVTDTLPHGPELELRKWAGWGEFEEVRFTRYAWGVCLSCVDYEQGVVLMHMDLQISHEVPPSDR